MTQLIEFKNSKGKILRGLLDKTNSTKGIIFAHGFERTTVERKFKAIVDKLKDKINLLRFDFAGCGLSDGDFIDFSVKKSSQELKLAIEYFKEFAHKVEEIILVGHSLGACIILDYLKNNPDDMVKKILFFAPALNQRELLRYYFVKGNNKEVEIIWQNYTDYLDGKSFLQDIKTEKRMTKEHWLGDKYFLENADINYADYLKNISQEILTVQGDKDDKVPIESNSLNVDVLVKKGDHDLQRPDMVEQWLPQVIEFLN